MWNPARTLHRHPSVNPWKSNTSFQLFLNGKSHWGGGPSYCCWTPCRSSSSLSDPYLSIAATGRALMATTKGMKSVSLAVFLNAVRMCWDGMVFWCGLWTFWVLMVGLLGVVALLGKENRWCRGFESWWLMICAWDNGIDSHVIVMCAWCCTNCRYARILLFYNGLVTKISVHHGNGFVWKTGSPASSLWALLSKPPKGPNGRQSRPKIVDRIETGRNPRWSRVQARPLCWSGPPYTMWVSRRFRLRYQV